MNNLPQSKLITIIMPCHNCERYIQQAVVSAMEQSYPFVELIIVDDGSSDASHTILEKLAQQYAGRIRIHQQARQGPYPARNLGLKYARGDFIAFLDADDYWDRDCLRKLHDALCEHGADISYCGWQNVHEDGTDREPFIPPQYKEYDQVRVFLKNCPWPIHAALTRRKLIDAAGGFSVRMYTTMDYDLWLRLSAMTRKMIRVPEVLAYYRWHGSSQISGVKWRQVLNTYNVKKEFIDKNPSLVADLSDKQLYGLTDGIFLQQAYAAYWQRDLVSSQRLFRTALRHRGWTVKDLKYMLPSLLPGPVYRALIHYVDAREASSVGA